ncbi:hypothetical protein PspLS_08894 [Pyricularia sp. CBS 133598]|nr:hypothetical protein PspLS_08894 [Pyricularia sp. CBS 133598]
MGFKVVVLGPFVPVLSTQALLWAHGYTLDTGGLVHTIGGERAQGDGGEARRCAVCRGSNLCVLEE